MTGVLPEWAWGNLISGRAIAARVRQSLIQFQPQFAARGTTIAIARFQPPPDSNELELARFDAARTSMEQKIKSFEFLGCRTEQISTLPFNLNPPEFRAILDRLNRDPNVRGIIVQYPVSREVEPFVRRITPEKDLDALAAASPFGVPATSEGIVRLVEPFASNALIAVVGARGFVGRNVAEQLRDRGFNILALDQRDQGFVQDDLLRVRDADIVVSTTGQPELLAYTAQKVGKAGEVATRQYVNELHLECLQHSVYKQSAEALKAKMEDWDFCTPLLDLPNFEINAPWQGDGGIDFRLVLAQRVTLQVEARSGTLNQLERLDWEVSQKEVDSNHGIFCVLSLDSEASKDFLVVGYLPTTLIKTSFPSAQIYKITARQLLFPAAIVEDFDELEGQELLNQFNPLIL